MSSIQRSFLSRFILQNLTLKVTSLFLAIILWLHATTLQTYDHELSIPLRITDLGDSLVIVSKPPQKVRVLFRGKGDQLWWLFVRKASAVVKLKDAHPGITEVILHSGTIHVPSGLDIQVADVLYPRKLRLELDTWKRKTIPVLVETEGLPAPEYVRVDELVEVSPRLITVEAPSSFLDNLDRVHAEPLDISGATETVSKKVRLRLPDPNSLVKYSAEAVTATARLEKLVRRTLRIEPEVDGSIPPGWDVTPRLVEVHLFAPESLSDSLNQLSGSRLSLMINPPSSLEDSVTVRVSASPPPWIRQCTWEPEYIAIVPADSSEIQE